MANKWDDEVEEAYAQLRESFASGKTRSMEWRKDQLQKFKTMTTKFLNVHEWICINRQKKLFDEVNPVMHEVQQCIDHLKEWATNTERLNILNIPGSCAILRSIGVVLVEDRNYPLTHLDPLLVLLRLEILLW